MKSTTKKKVLFICTHNSARSQMAEGLMRKIYGEDYDVYSAGTNPSEINAYAIQVMEEIGIDVSHQRSKSVDEYHNMKFDYVITVCDQAKESCPFFPGGIIIHKGFKDPSQSHGTEEEILDAFRKARDEIKDWVEEFVKSERKKNQ
jgi:arsenate reductase